MIETQTEQMIVLAMEKSVNQMTFAEGIEGEELEELQKLPRWQRPVITDRAAFLAAHPECRVTPELLEDLAGEIHAVARSLDSYANRERQIEIETEIIAGIIDCATYYRTIDDITGQPNFDYLAQTKGYVVRHASGKISSEIRRERKEAAVTTPLLNALSLAEGEYEGADEEGLIADPADWNAEAVGEQVEFRDLVIRINENLSPDQARVFALVVEGHTRPEIGSLLGLARQRVHEYMSSIRLATAAALSEAGHLSAAPLPADQAEATTKPALEERGADDGETADQVYVTA